VPIGIVTKPRKPNKIAIATAPEKSTPMKKTWLDQSMPELMTAA
jgi:hypothetical protein